MLVGKQSDALAKQVYVFTLVSILSVVRGRTNTRKGGQLLALVTNGRQDTRVSQRNKQISEISQNVILDYPLSSVASACTDYGTDSAHMRTDN